jgi:hypothetical protein
MIDRLRSLFESAVGRLVVSTSLTRDIVTAITDEDESSRSATFPSCCRLRVAPREAAGQSADAPNERLRHHPTFVAMEPRS